MTTAIIICAGEGERWGDYLGGPKQLVTVEGERLLDRTVRLARRHTDTVYVVSKPGDLRYESPGAVRVDARLIAGNGDADKFLSSRHLWSTTGRTVVLYGDCWFDETAMATIFRPQPDWQMYCRPGASEVTGATSGECFAIGFHPQHHREFSAALRKVVRLWRRAELRHCGGWQVYRVMAGARADRLNLHRVYGRHTVIGGWTEDFDRPEDLQKWLARRPAR